MLGMGRHQRAKTVLRFVFAALLVGVSLWVTWGTSAFWQSCTGASWNAMNASCAEAMTSYNYVGLLYLWGGLVLVVAGLVIARIVPRFPAGVISIVAVLLACPVADSGFFWVEWGSADGIPGQGLWTACWLAVTGLTLVYPPSSQNLSESNDTRNGAAEPQPSSAPST